VRSFDLRFDKNGYGLHGSMEVDDGQFVLAHCTNEDGSYITYLNAMKILAKFVTDHSSEFVMVVIMATWEGETYTGIAADDAQVDQQYHGVIVNNISKPVVSNIRGHIVKSVSGFEDFVPEVVMPVSLTTMFGAYKM
jgi:hypothetical protein